jgi:hypothetical protein
MMMMMTMTMRMMMMMIIIIIIFPSLLATKNLANHCLKKKRNYFWRNFATKKKSPLGHSPGNSKTLFCALSVRVRLEHIDEAARENTPSMLLQRLWRLWPPQQPHCLLRAIANNVSSAACQSVLPHEHTVLGEFFTVIISLSLF